MRLAEAVEKEIVVGDGLLDELDEEHHFRAVDHQVNSVLLRLHGLETGEGLADEDNRGVATGGHLGALNEARLRFSGAVLAANSSSMMMT